MKGKGKITANIKRRIIRLLGGYTEPTFPPPRVELLRTEVQPVTLAVTVAGFLGRGLAKRACGMLAEKLMDSNCVKVEMIPDMFSRGLHQGGACGALKVIIRVIPPPQYDHNTPEPYLTDQEIEDFRDEASRITQVPREMLFGKEAKDDEVKRDE